MQGARTRLTTQHPLFAWEALEDSPSLQTIRAFLTSVPDGPLLAADAAARRRMSEKGRERCLKGLDWWRMVDELEALYVELIRQRRASRRG